MAEAMYSGDYEGVILMYDYKVRSGGVTFPDVYFTSALNGGVSTLTGSGPYGVYFETGYGGDKGGSFKCPTENRAFSFGSGATEIWKRGQYGVNGRLHQNLYSSSEADWIAKQKLIKNMTFVKRPSVAISFADCGLLSYDGVIASNPVRDNLTTISYISFRHSNGDFRENAGKSLGNDSMPLGWFPKGFANILYFDGHVKAQSPNQLYNVPKNTEYSDNNQYNWALYQGLRGQ